MSVISSLLLLEHINLNVGNIDVAARFYLDGLGCCPDPDRQAKSKSMHVNVGPLCQFHTADPAHEPCIEKEGPQVWRGVITIAYRPQEFRAAVERLQAMIPHPPLAGTLCAMWALGDSTCDVTCPFGNKFVLRTATPGEAEALAPPGIGRPGSQASQV